MKIVRPVKKVASKKGDLIFSLFFVVIMYLVAWIILPTVCTPPDNSEFGNLVIDYLFSLYENAIVLYIIVAAAMACIAPWGVYKLMERTFKKKYENTYVAEEIIEKYGDFVQDAVELVIIGGDLDFLLASEKQLERIKSIGSRCRIVYRDKQDVECQNERLVLYRELISCGVGLKMYEDRENELRLLRGQIKVGRDGTSSCLFVNRIQNQNGVKKYEVLNLTNQFVISQIKQGFEEIYATAKNPLISFVLFDLGGVYFDGDFNKDFLDKVNNKLPKKINRNRKQKLVLDKDLNLGNKTIIDWVRQKSGYRLTEKEKNEIECLWKNVWKPNPRMEELVNLLRNHGYKVGIMSNLDELNGDEYNERGYFGCFPTEYRFLSYETKMLKPDPKFFGEVIRRTNLDPCQILFIDDHEENIKAAHECGMEVIQFSIQMDPSTDSLRRALEEKNIPCDD